MILEHNYVNFIHGKRVAFIGPAPNLIGRGLGGFIDSFDVVVRSNHFIELLREDREGSRELWEDYGRKTNVVYMNWQYYREYVKKMTDFTPWAKSGLEWICAKSFNNKHKGMVRKTGAKVRTVGPMLDYIVKNICPSALMGPIALRELVSCSPSYLYVDGIDFNISRKKEFEINNYKEYVPGYLPDVIREQGNRVNINKKQDPHDVLANTKIIKDLYDQKRLVMPEHLAEIMNKIIKGEITQQ